MHKVTSTFYQNKYLRFLSIGLALCLFGCETTLQYGQNQSNMNPDNSFNMNRRSLEIPIDKQLIQSFPMKRKQAYIQAKFKWDTGVTMTMVQGNQVVIDALKHMWITLSEFYSPNHFGQSSAGAYIDEYIQYRYRFHYARYEKDGRGTGGSIVSVLASSDIVSDLESMIDEVVYAIVMYDDGFDYDSWKNEWTKKYE